MARGITKCAMTLAVAISTFGMVALTESKAAHAVTINTLPNWDGGSAVGSWGVGATSTYGQTFTVTGPENVLQSFSFQMGSTTSPIPYKAYVAQWFGNGQGAVVGPLLYSSAVQSYSKPTPGYQETVINTGGVQLTTGNKYVAFLSTSGFWAGQPGSATTFGYSSDQYAGGEFVFYNTGDAFAPLVSSNWQTWINGDTAFKANLSGGASAVPVPPAAVATGVGAVIGALKARKRQQATA
jgi:hypothetical protein